MTSRRVEALSLHADWQCRRSGACCSSGWPIAVERDAARRLASVFPPASLVRCRDRVVLATDAQGRCAFFEHDDGNACSIHRRLGHEALPLACRQFPRVSVESADRVSIALSHYCPSVAERLFEDRPLTIAAHSPSFPPDGEYVGLDARNALPPLLRPGVLLGWDGLAAWERGVVATLAADGPPRIALARIAAAAERARAWSVERGPLPECVEDSFAARHDLRPNPPPPARSDWELAACAVPDGVPKRSACDANPEVSARLESPPFDVVVRRYLASKAFGSWCALQGRGVRTSALLLRVSLGVAHVEAARACDAAGLPLDRTLLREVVRAADLLLVHLVDPQALADLLSACEDEV